MRLRFGARRLPRERRSFGSDPLRNLLIAFGIVSLALGVAWPVVKRLRLGRLPGDFAIHRPGFVFYLPITTSILLSVVLSAIIWWLRR